MKRITFLLVAFFLSTSWLYAQTSNLIPENPSQKIPDVLKPWIPWVLDQQEYATCPVLNGSPDDTANASQCIWGSVLQLSFNEKNGELSQKWKVYADSWVPLAGNREHWPQNVKIDGKEAVAFEIDEAPHVWLKKGEYTLTATFFWSELPESFQIPQETGMLDLSIRGKKIDFPNREADGNLWLEKREPVATGEDKLDMHVYRRITDSIPAYVTTQLVLQVSGKAREATLGTVILPGFIPFSIQSQLPSQLENGKLKVQLRPGNWTLTILARSETSLQSITLPAPSDLPVEEEIWVFEAQPHLRVVDIDENVPTVDPQQTTLPVEWRRFPAYRLVPGSDLKIHEKMRGDSENKPDQLSLHRYLWLDFDGQGLTIKDTLKGSLNQSVRLNTHQPMKLGRVDVNGQNQLVTSSDALQNSETQPSSISADKTSKMGIEIREGNIQLTADSRLERTTTLSAVGWDHDFQNVSATLDLPPGWRLFHATGVDKISTSWWQDWTLLDLFLVFILCLSFAKLYGIGWGFLALLTFVLVIPESGSIQWIWLAVLVGAALIKVLPEGKLKTVARLYQIFILIVLLKNLVPFMVQQVRASFSPILDLPQTSLEEEYASTADYRGNNLNYAPPQSYGKRVLQNERQGLNLNSALNNDRDYKEQGDIGASATPPPPPVVQGTEINNRDEEKLAKPKEAKIMHQENAPLFIERGEIQGNGGKGRFRSKVDRFFQQKDSKIQTGPGLPRWTWNPIQLTWTGSVSKDHQISLYLISPKMGAFLNCLRVALLALLLLCLMRLRQILPKRLPVKAALLLLPLLTIGWADHSQAELPSPELLEELKTRLLKKPSCLPDCVSIPRMQLEATDHQLTLRLEIGTQAEVAFPIPGNPSEWMPETILLNGNTTAPVKLAEDNKLMILLPAGIHQLVLQGPLPAQDTVQLSLPVTVYRVEAQAAASWEIEGIDENGNVSGAIQLIRQSSATRPHTESAPSGKISLPPLLQVSRTLILGLDWQVQTTVTRISPIGSPVLFDIPLLSGESVTSDSIKVEDKKVKLNFGPQDTSLSWDSRLPITSQLALKASDSSSIIEIWQVDVSAVWHANLKGIRPIHPQNASQRFPMEWRPWPKEELQLDISRPQGVEGPTVTIEKSILDVTPGPRQTDATLTLTLRSSLGGQHTVTLPANSTLQSLSINNQAQPIQQKNRDVTFMLNPGVQTIILQWQEERGLSPWFKTPEVNLHLPSVNSSIQVHVPEKQWLLWLQGPTMGPAILFWGFLIVMVLVAVGLSRIPLAPLKTHQWILLSLGLTQVSALAAVSLALWLFALGYRKKQPFENKYLFNFYQFVLIGLTGLALTVLFSGIYSGLLGTPEMQIQGNRSSSNLLRWFQDRTNNEKLPQASMLSVSVFYYRLAMLGWALWIAASLLKWLKWSWNSFSTNGFWKPLGKAKIKVQEP